MAARRGREANAPRRGGRAQRRPGLAALLSRSPRPSHWPLARLERPAAAALLRRGRPRPPAPLREPAPRARRHPHARRGAAGPELPVPKRKLTDARTECAFGAPAEQATATVALIGDSHAQHWRSALAVRAERRGWRVLDVSGPLCMFSTATTGAGPPFDKACGQWNADVLAWLTAHPEIHTIFTAGKRRQFVRPAPGQSGFEARRDGYAGAGRRCRLGDVDRRDPRRPAGGRPDQGLRAAPDGAPPDAHPGVRGPAPPRGAARPRRRGRRASPARTSSTSRRSSATRAAATRSSAARSCTRTPTT